MKGLIWNDSCTAVFLSVVRCVALSSILRDLKTQYNIVLPREEGLEALGVFFMSRLGKTPGPVNASTMMAAMPCCRWMHTAIVRLKIENLNQPTSLEHAI